MIVDLIIPAHNEESNIDPLFDALSALPSDVIRRVILADNGSTDDTAVRAAERGAIVVREPRRGYGGACLKALAWIRVNDEPPPDVVVFLDADLSDDPAELPRLLAPIEAGRAELVIGSRIRRAEPGALNLAQRFGNRLACALMRLLAAARYTDLGPFRAVRWAALARLDMCDRTWGWTVEMQMKAAIIDLSVEEVDVNYRRRRSGKSKISGTLRGVLTAGTRIIATLVLLRMRRSAIRRAAL